MDSLEKTQTVGGGRVPVELSHTGSTGSSRFSCLFPLLSLFSFPLSEYLSNSSLCLLLRFLCLSFSLTYMCVRTYTHTHVHIPGAGRKLSGLMLGSEHSEIESRFPCSQKRSAQREKGNGQWTERCLEFPKSCAWRGTGVSRAVSAAESQETKDSFWDQWHLTSYLTGKQVSSGGKCGLLCFCAHFQLGLVFFQANLACIPTHVKQIFYGRFNWY